MNAQASSDRRDRRSDRTRNHQPSTPI
jgi:hypothetical protein